MISCALLEDFYSMWSFSPIFLKVILMNGSYIKWHLHLYSSVQGCSLYSLTLAEHRRHLCSSSKRSVEGGLILPLFSDLIVITVVIYINYNSIITCMIFLFKHM
jgi:hypothetical protein